MRPNLARFRLGQGGKVRMEPPGDDWLHPGEPIAQITVDCIRLRKFSRIQAQKRKGSGRNVKAVSEEDLPVAFGDVGPTGP
jgi:hypothetical protein